MKKGISQAETVTSEPLYHKLGFWGSVFLLVGTLFNGYMMYKGQNVSVQSTQVMSFITALQNEVKELNFKVKELQSDKERWRLAYIDELMKGVDKDIALKKAVNESEVRLSFIKKIPYSSWIKCRSDDGIFRFRDINDRFKQRFKVTDDIIGLSDYDVFPNLPELAQLYQEGDQYVANTGRSIKDSLNMPDENGNLSKDRYIKFDMDMPLPPVCVGGIIAE